MTFDQIWQQLRSKSSKLDNPDATVEFKPTQLKQLLRQVYEQGQASVPKVDAKPSGGNFFDSLMGRGF